MMQDYNNTNELKEIIISDNFNESGLLKLAELNQIKIQVRKGWYPLLIELVKELDRAGWDRKINCIKEKYGILEFQTDSKHDQLVSEFEQKSESVCETCGKTGELRDLYGTLYTACENHIIKVN